MQSVNLTEFNKLVAYLRNKGVPHKINNRPECRNVLKTLEEEGLLRDDEYDAGLQVVVYEDKNCTRRIWDVICGHGSYGVASGLLEVMGQGMTDRGDDVTGFLTAEDVVRRMLIRDRYKAR